MQEPMWKKGEKNLKKKGNYDILTFKYPPFGAGAEQREMERGSPQKIAFTWRGINLDSFDQAWELICQYCKSNITEVAYNTWFSRLKPVSLDFDRATAIIEAPTNSTSKPCFAATATCWGRLSKMCSAGASRSRSASTRS